jgi:preprotein translocase subunit SecB
MKSPLELERYFVSDQAVTARNAFSSEKDIVTRIEEFSVTNEAIRMTAPEDAPAKWQVTVRIKHLPAPETNFPYDFRLTIVGIFHSTIENGDPAHIERLMKINGSSILYGMSREIIRANTERGPWSGIVIPTHSFYEPKPSEEPSVEDSKPA